MQNVLQCDRQSKTYKTITVEQQCACATHRRMLVVRVKKSCSLHMFCSVSHIAIHFALQLFCETNKLILIFIEMIFFSVFSSKNKKKMKTNI